MKQIKITPGRFILLSFATVILTGTLLLSLPFAKNSGASLSFIDTLFTATSAVCVTGLAPVDIADSFSLFGRIVVMLLIQTGGLGIAIISVSLIMLTGKKVNIREQSLVKEALNYPNFSGILSLVKTVIFITVVFELSGMVMSFFVFKKYFHLSKALEASIFHAVSAFNNAGFDVFGNFKNLADFRTEPLLILITCVLIIGGGLGFFVISDVLAKRSFKKLALQSKIVLTVTVFLLFFGTVILKFTENIPWLEAFFYSVSARTAGFSVSPLKSFSNAGILIMIILMFIGASPGSTGGGIKTTTAFSLLASIMNIIKNKEFTAFNKRLPETVLYKSFIVTSLAFGVTVIATILLCIFEPYTGLRELIFETVSAIATVGLSTGITPTLSTASKIVLVLTMFLGRTGPLTAATLLVTNRKNEIRRPEETIAIG